VEPGLRAGYSITRGTPCRIKLLRATYFSAQALSQFAGLMVNASMLIAILLLVTSAIPSRMDRGFAVFG
jgi:hypothetical protein